MDPRLQGRIEPSDVIQEDILEAPFGWRSTCASPPFPFFLWPRFLTAQKLVEMHRHHLQTDMRDAVCKICPYHGPLPEAKLIPLAESVYCQRAFSPQRSISVPTVSDWAAAKATMHG